MNEINRHTSENESEVDKHTNKIVSHAYNKFISIIGSVHLGEDPGKYKEDAVWRLVVHPVTQVGLVFTFTLFTSASYVILLWVANDKSRIPSDWQFYVFVMVYIIVWRSFYIEHDLEKAGSRLGVISGNGLENRQGLSRWPPPEVERRSQYHTVKTGVAIRVFAMVAASIIISCWLTLYSGGPFQSAYSQVIVAYPLFATNIARNRLSLMSVYMFTACSMGAAEAVKYFRYDSYGTQSTSWYIGVTLILLVASAIVADHSRRIARKGDKIPSDMQG